MAIKTIVAQPKVVLVGMLGPAAHDTKLLRGSDSIGFIFSSLGNFLGDRVRIAA